MTFVAFVRCDGCGLQTFVRKAPTVLDPLPGWKQTSIHRTEMHQGAPRTRMFWCDFCPTCVPRRHELVRALEGAPPAAAPDAAPGTAPNAAPNAAPNVAPGVTPAGRPVASRPPATAAVRAGSPQAPSTPGAQPSRQGRWAVRRRRRGR